MNDKIDTKNILKRFLKYLKKEKKSLIFVVILVVISTLCSFISPLIISVILDNYLGQNKNFLIILISLLIIYIIYSLFTYITSYVMAGVSEKVLYKLRKDLFNHLDKLPLSYFDKNKKGDTMSRFTNDISVISDTLSDAIVDVIGSLIMLFGTTIIMFIINPLLSIITIISVPLFFVIALKIGIKSGIYFKKQQDLLGDLNSYSEEVISKMAVIKNFCKEKSTLEKFKKKNEEFKDISIKAEVYSNLIMPINNIIGNFLNIILIALGSLLVVNNKITIGILLAFTSYSTMFRNPINTLALTYSSIQSSLAGLGRIFNLMDEKEEINKVSNLKISEGYIKFRDVCFGYSDNLVLKHFNLDIKPNKVVALIGETGSGKTTIGSLITRFYDISSGNIFIDNHDIVDFDKNYLRKNIGFVLQDVYLFKGTVYDNIRYGNWSASEDEVILASKRACAYNFIEKLPLKFDYMIEEEGSNLSIGERQLISIARTILANPKILILDEATSSIDTKTERDVNLGMKELMKGKTTLIIAHRLSTIKNADKIIVIKDGVIIEEGTHKNLLEKKGMYFSLYHSSFNG